MSSIIAWIDFISKSSIDDDGAVMELLHGSLGK
jgi:hypothetical protein